MNRKNNTFELLKKVLLLTGVLFLMTNTYAQHQGQAAASQVPSPPSAIPANSKIEAKTFNDKANGWGYDIFIDGKAYIHQPVIPGVGGRKGFKEKKDAEKTAALVVKKIKAGAGLPSITHHELDSLKVLR